MNTDSSYSSSQSKKINVGSVIGNRYLIQSILGQGEFSCTYLAVDYYRFYEPCILKAFNYAIVKLDEKLKEKFQNLFQQEIEAIYQSDHRQIAKFLAYFTVKERLFLVQEYIKGKSYDRLLQQRRQQGQTFRETEIISWLINLLLVLEYIHDRGIIHREISPHNIIQADDRNLPVLINFGIGKQSLSILEREYQHFPNSPGSFSSSMKVNKSFSSKISYAPYEQVKLGLAFPCSDLYALGVTIIVLLTGKQPYSLIDENTLEWRWRYHTRVSEFFARIVNKLLAYNPKHRYQSARAVFNDLLLWQQNRQQSQTKEEGRRKKKWIPHTSYLMLQDEVGKNFPLQKASLQKTRGIKENNSDF